MMKRRRAGRPSLWLSGQQRGSPDGWRNDWEVLMCPGWIPVKAIGRETILCGNGTKPEGIMGRFGGREELILAGSKENQLLRERAGCVRSSELLNTSHLGWRAPALLCSWIPTEPVI